MTTMLIFHPLLRSGPHLRGISSLTLIIHTMPLREYLYVDEKRLDSYAEQIGTPVTFDKVPVWKVMFGLTGPSVEGQQQRPGRARSTSEKIDLLLQYVEKHKESNSFAWDRDEQRNPFVWDRYEAVKIVLPIQEEKLVLWVCESKLSHLAQFLLVPSIDSVRIFLIQDDGSNKDSRVQTFSSYSSIFAFFEQAPQLKLLSPDGEAIRNEKFLSDPIASLRSIGATIGTSRKIETLFRIRQTHVDSPDSHTWRPVIWAYPIFIAAI